MNKYLLLTLLLLILSCGMQTKYEKNNKISNHNLQLITNIYEINQDSLFIKTLISFPMSNLRIFSITKVI